MLTPVEKVVPSTPVAMANRFVLGKALAAVATLGYSFVQKHRAINEGERDDLDP